MKGPLSALTNPYSMIAETARRLRRSRQTELALVALPPVTATAIALAWLRPELALVAAIGLGLLVFRIARLAVSERDAAGWIDRSLPSKDHFLTLATTPVAENQPLRPLVEVEAGLLARSGPRSAALPPPRLRRIAASMAGSLAFLIGFFLLIGRLGSVPATSGLEEVARELAALDGNVRAGALAGALRSLAEKLGNPELSVEEKRQLIAEAKAEVEKSERGSGSGQGGGGGGGQGEGNEGQGEGGGGEGSLRDQAKRELGKLENALGAGASGDSKESNEPPKEGEKREGGAGGLQGPGEDPKGAGEREDAQGEGNKPGEGDQPAGDQTGGDEGQPSEENPRPEGKEGQNQGQSPQGSGGEGGSGQPEQSKAEGEPAERFYEAGEGEGFRIEDGRYVKVRIPENAEAGSDVETVERPGDPRPDTPFGNAPMPSAGAPGEIRDEQPVPLEYRGILRAQQ